MKNVLMSFAIAILCMANVNAQEKGDWYSSEEKTS